MKQIPINGFDDTLNISDSTGVLTVESVHMDPPKDGRCVITVQIRNNSSEVQTLAVSAYTDGGTIGPLYSPGAMQRATLKAVPPNWSGLVEFQYQTIFETFGQGSSVRLDLGTIGSTPTNIDQEIGFLPSGTDVFFSKQYYLNPNRD